MLSGGFDSFGRLRLCCWEKGKCFAKKTQNPIRVIEHNMHGKKKWNWKNQLMIGYILSHGSSVTFFLPLRDGSIDLDVYIFFSPVSLSWMCIIKQEEQFIETTKTINSPENIVFGGKKLDHKKPLSNTSSPLIPPSLLCLILMKRYGRRPQATLMA